MFAQMKSRRDRKEVACLCENKCPCHKGDNWRAILKACTPIIIGAIIFFATIYLFTKNLPKTIPLIEVKGKMCEIHYKVTGHTSTGAPLGHDEAICK
jgi:hypothetical protein